MQYTDNEMLEIYNLEKDCYIMTNYHKNDNVELNNNFIYVNGKLVESYSEQSKYWDMVLKN